MAMSVQGEKTTSVVETPTFQHIKLIAVICITLLGGYIRLYPALRTDFPVNDGGLFFHMIRELQSNSYQLPTFTTYNHSGIPFVYPPLGLYLVAGISDLSGWPLLDTIRLFPPIIMAFTIPAFWLLAQRALGGIQEPLLATLAFAMLPSSFLWPIMGGGVTRAPGCLFALLALVSIYDLYRKPRIRLVMLASVWTSLTVLSHSEAAIFVVYGASLLFLFFGRNRSGLLASLAIAVCVLVCTAPWWVLIFSRHGIAPLVAAAQSDSRTYWRISGQLSEEPWLPLISMAGLLGFIICLLKGPKWVPVWILVILAFQSRGAEKFVAVPLALLAARAVSCILVPPFADAIATLVSLRVRRWWQAGLIGTSIGYLVSAALFFVNTAVPLHALSTNDRVAMEWVATHTSRESTFLIIDNATWFGEDRIAEWFPALTDRMSVTTVQGSEWLSNGEFYRRWREFDLLQQCGASAVCLEAQVQQNNQHLGYIYLSKQQGVTEHSTTIYQALEHALRSDTRYRVVYDNVGVLIVAL
jgi:Dolichyl-phosphate-mannose-protein mannosyltransferase